MNQISSIYKNDKISFKNNQNYCVVKDKMNIKELLTNRDYYQNKVKITTNDKEYETYIYHVNDDGINTLQNDIILFDNIIDIEIIK